MITTAEQGVRAWAEMRGLKESRRWYRDCLHGLTRRPASSLNCDCPRGDSEVLDHARLWNRDGRPALLLAHVYGDVSAGSVGWAKAEAYAASFGVRVVFGDPDDAWYGFGTTPIRYEAVAGMRREPLAYAERLQRLTIAMVVEKLRATLAEGQEHKAGRSDQGRKTRRSDQGPPARNPRSLTGTQEG